MWYFVGNNGKNVTGCCSGNCLFSSLHKEDHIYSPCFSRHMDYRKLSYLNLVVFTILMTFCWLDLANIHDALSVRFLYPRICDSTPHLQNLEDLEPDHGVNIVLAPLAPFHRLPTHGGCVPCSYSGRPYPASVPGS